MKLSLVKSTIAYTMSFEKKLPDDDVLASYLNQSLYYICGKCVPNELVGENSTDGNVLRFLPSGKFITIPEYPDFSNSEAHLQIDESLTYAAINYTCFLISSRADLKVLADEIICDFIATDGEVND